MNCTGLIFHGEPILPLLVRHETGPLLLRVFARHELTPQLVMHLFTFGKACAHMRQLSLRPLAPACARLPPASTLLRHEKGSLLARALARHELTPKLLLLFSGTIRRRCRNGFLQVQLRNEVCRRGRVSLASGGLKPS